MATTALNVLRQEFSLREGLTTPEAADWPTSTNIAADNLVISQALRNAGYEDLEGAASGDDPLEGWYLYLKGTTNDLLTRKVSAYDASAAQTTVGGQAWTAETAARNFELHKQHPTFLRAMLNAARRTAFPYGLWRPLVDETLFTGSEQFTYNMPSAIVGSPRKIELVEPLSGQGAANNLFSNGGFDSGTTSWTSTSVTTTAVSSPTAPNQFRVLKGSGAIKNISTASTLGTVLQSIATPTDYVGLKLNLSLSVYCLAASRLKVRIKVDSTNTDGTGELGIHRGLGWQKLSVSLDLEPTDPTSFTLDAGVMVTSATGQITFYVDEAFLTVGQVGVQESETLDLLEGWRWKEWIDSDGVTTGQVHFPYQLSQRKGLRIYGKGYLSSVTAEADTMEIGAPQTELLYAQAAVEMYQRLARQGQVAARVFGPKLAEARAIRDQAVRDYGMPAMPYVNSHGLGRW